MKRFLLVPLSLALLSGCASYFTERPVTDTGDVVYEPAGAQVDPNPNWDVNARDIRQHPYSATWRSPWTVYGTSVQTSTESEKNTGYHIRSQDDLP
ncbi:MAG: hypothetical protein JWM68_4136 [Verrucomicrobiales bacterium]|nr:hypothetical protein [Verrucomicrobiales bacterium]